ncbi:MAG: zinc-binding dehydrogenase [Myxococcales bacterium]|nr:zinc-binding dehydrogenase [Myxococcales bacterium]
MRAAVLHEVGKTLEIADVEIDRPKAGEVRLEVAASGICRSDLSVIHGTLKSPMPVVLGHEAAGTVVELGEGVTDVSVGDRVIVSLTLACIPIEPEIPFERACLLGCGVITGAAFNTPEVTSGAGVAVIGCGGVGLAAIQGVRIAGAGRIFAIDPIEQRRQAALESGATEARDPEGAVAGVIEATGGGVDAAIECVGRPETMMDAFNMIRPGGRAIVVGLASFKDVLQIPPIMLLTEKSLMGSIYGSANPAVDFPKLIALRNQGRLNLDALVGKVRPFAEINEGIAEMREGSLTRVVLAF